jgi:hypothetical protein
VENFANFEDVWMIACLHDPDLPLQLGETGLVSGQLTEADTLDCEAFGSSLVDAEIYFGARSGADFRA